MGWTTPCPAGFASDPSGWGCHEILPSAPCTGATYETLGSATCQPIGDCAAPFPPAGATVFVDASFAPAQLDATHFTSIAAAVAASQAGAIVAVEAGTYEEPVGITSAVSIVGRCAEKVILQGPSGTYSGIAIEGVTSPIVIHGLTIAGFVGGVLEQGSSVTVDACLLTGNTGTGVGALGGSLMVTGSRIFGTLQEGTMAFAGAFAQDGGKLLLDHVALVHNMVAGVAVGGPGDVQLTQSVVWGTLVRSDNGQDGSGVELSQAGTVEITDSAILESHTHGVEVSGKGTRATITGSVIRDTGPDDIATGYGVQVDFGASATIDSSMLAGNAAFGAWVTRSGKLDVTHSVVRGTNLAGDLVGMGIDADLGGTLSLTDVAVAGARDVGLAVDGSGTTAAVTGSLVRDTVPFADPTLAYANGVGVMTTFGATLSMTDSTVANATLVGVEVGSICAPNSPKDCGGTATLSRDVVLGTQPNASGGDGLGLSAEEQATLTVDSSVFAGNYTAGVFLSGKGVTGTITSSMVRDTGLGTATQYGYGLVVLDGATGSLAGSFVRDNLGVALAFRASSAGVDSTIVAHNQVGVYVTGATLQEVAMQPGTLAADEVVISATQFVDNVTRVSADELPLPPAFVVPPPLAQP